MALAGQRPRRLTTHLVRQWPAFLVLVLPLLAYVWLTLNPARDSAFIEPTGHLMAVALVSFLAAIVSFMVARTALRLEEQRVFLISTGFAALAGLFTVHAISTPGVLLGGPGIVGATSTTSGSSAPAPAGGSNPYATSPYGSTVTAPSQALSYDGTVVGLSAFLSLFVPSLLFASAYAPVTASISRRWPLARGGLLAAVLVGLLGYLALAVWVPEFLGNLPLSRPPISWLLAFVSAGLLLYAAWGQAREFLRTEFPSQGALVLAFVMLAQAQVYMVVTDFWHLSWWNYHVVMLIAVGLALGALFIELDRRRGLERFVSRELVERLVAGDTTLEGQRRVLTMLFADLRGSTALADKLDPGHVVVIINAYVTEVARCVLANGGMVNKYLGDGLMAIFGIQEDSTHGAAAAAAAALDIRRALTELNERRTAEGVPALGFGVGVHTGPVILGAVGLHERADFTAIGDAVNVAARLEGLSKDYEVDLVMSEQTYVELPAGQFKERLLGESTVRGKRDPMRVYTLD